VENSVLILLAEWTAQSWHILHKLYDTQKMLQLN